MWAVATLTFFAIRLIPGDPAQAILGGPGSQASQEALDQVRRDYGLDQPLLVQYFAMLGRLLTGDLGDSYALKVPVAELLGAQIGGTLLLAVLSLALAWVLALALSLVSTGRGRIATAVGEGVELTAAALPQFWLAAVLIAIFSTGLGWFPPVATGTPSGLVLPVVTLAIPLAGLPRAGDAREPARRDAAAVRDLGPRPRRERGRPAPAAHDPPCGAARHQPLGLGARVAALGGGRRRDDLRHPRSRAHAAAGGHPARHPRRHRRGAAHRVRLRR